MKLLPVTKMFNTNSIIFLYNKIITTSVMVTETKLEKKNACSQYNKNT